MMKFMSLYALILGLLRGGAATSDPGQIQAQLEELGQRIRALEQREPVESCGSKQDAHVATTSHRLEMGPAGVACSALKYTRPNVCACAPGSAVAQAWHYGRLSAAARPIRALI
jgi:hypothetical protein